MIDPLLINMLPEKTECKIEIPKKKLSTKEIKFIIDLAKFANDNGLKGRDMSNLCIRNVNGKNYFKCWL